MVKQLDYISAHYHRVDTWTWLRVRQLLHGFLLGRLSAGCSKFVVELANEDFETIRDFCEQMDIGYLHPRRDSLHVALCSTMYGTMKIPARALERMRQQRLAHSCNEKKPKSNHKTE